MITIYHNPRCSKSREALALVQQFAAERKMTLQVVDYQKTPLTLDQLITLRQQLGGSAADMVRTNEEEYAGLNLSATDEAALLRAIAAHPKLLQRPIVSHLGRAAIGRPLEHIENLLQAAKP